MTIGIHKVGYIAFFAVLISCTKNPDHEGVYYISGFSDENIEIYVNGNPTARGNALSLFVIQGDNRIEHRGDFTESGFSIRIGKTKNVFSMDAKIILDVERGAEEAERNPIVTFYEPLWWNWNWQDADLLPKELSQKDRAQIIWILDQICDKVKKNEVDVASLVPEPYVKWWTKDQELIDRTVEGYNQMKEQFPKEDELIFKRSPKENIEFLVGTQIVMIRDANSEKLFYLGIDESSKTYISNGELQWNCSYCSDALFFCRFNGEWTLLMQIN